jgi:hypothetical protein
VAGLVDHAWQAEAIAVPFLAIALWLVISDVRERGRDGDDCKALVEQGPRDALGTRSTCFSRLEAHASGSPLCQDALGRRVLVLLLAGPGSDFLEEPAWG